MITIRLGVIPTIAPYVLPAMLPEVRRRYPGVELHIRETQTDTLVRELLHSQLDVVLLAFPIAHKEVEAHAHFADRFMLAVPSEPEVHGDRRITRGDLADAELLLLEEGHCLRDQALDYCALVRRETMRNFGATSLSTIMQMVANGRGVTLLPEMSRDMEARDGRIKLLRFAAPEPRRTIGLAWRKSSPRGEAFAEFGDLIAETCGPEGGAVEAGSD